MESFHLCFIPNLNSRLHSWQHRCSLSNSAMSSAAFAHVADGGAHRGLLLLLRAHVWGHVTKYCCGLKFCQLLFSSYLLFIHSKLFRGNHLSLSRVDYRPYCRYEMWHHFASFYLPSLVVFPCPHLTHSPRCFPLLLWSFHLFLFTSNDPHFSSPFCLTTPLFGGSSTAGLKWPHLLPLILFVPHLTFSLFLLLPSALLPASVHHPPTLSSDSITFCTLFIYSSSPSLPSPTISPSTSHQSENTYLPSLWTFDTLSPCLWFNFHSSSVCLPYSYLLPHSLFYYFVFPSELFSSVQVFIGNLVLAWLSLFLGLDSHWEQD